MKNKKILQSRQAFTLVELIVSIMIISILASIWFYSYVWYISEARDSERKADMWVLISSLNVYKQNRWGYPKPWNVFNIINSGSTVAYQWKIDKSVSLTTLDNLPFDPYKWKSYWYSITTNKQEFQIAMTLENWDFPIAMLDWNYHTVSYKILPNIMLALSPLAWVDIEIAELVWSWAENRQKFILDKWLNLLYSILDPYEPVYGYQWLDLWTDIIPSWDINFWQNSDYRTCLEISDAWKSIWDWEYQILNWSGLLEDVNCTF
jgi:prepilin-type N-terminal cleavage/methylation domain-containing protein